MWIPLVVFCFCHLSLCFLRFRFLKRILLHVFLLFSWTNFFLLLFLRFVCWAYVFHSFLCFQSLAFLFLSLSATLSSLEQFCFSLVTWNCWDLSSKLQQALYRKIIRYIFWVQLCPDLKNKNIQNNGFFKVFFMNRAFGMISVCLWCVEKSVGGYKMDLLP